MPVSTSDSPLGKPLEVIRNGLVCESIKALAKQYGMVPAKITQRLASGWTAEQAVGSALGIATTARGSPSTVTGARHGSLVEASKALALNPGAIASRFANGHSTGDAFSGNLKDRPGMRNLPI